MSDISLYLDQDNELRFNVAIEGSKPGTPKYRLVLEGKGFNYAFAGQQSAQGEVLFTVPSMKNVLKEGRYHAELEVMVDDRYFVPLQFDADFESSIKVVAESVARAAPKRPAVTASIITNNAPSAPAQQSLQQQQDTRIKEAPAAKTIVEKLAPAPTPAPRASGTKQATRDTINESKTIDATNLSAEDLRNLIRLSLRQK